VAIESWDVFSIVKYGGASSATTVRFEGGNLKTVSLFTEEDQGSYLSGPSP
jgi:hypothetical protein